MDAGKTERFYKMHHQTATLSFYSELSSRQKDIDYIGPIENDEGKIIRGLQNCLKSWVDFYARLYSKPKVAVCFDSSNYPPVRKTTFENLTTLNDKITDQDVVWSINTLKDYRSPGANILLSRDFTILLYELGGGYIRWDTIYFIRCLLNNSWSEEVVPVALKKTVSGFYLKLNKKSDPYKRENYRPISLLTVPMKVYEQVIKQRLVDALEEIEFFSKAQAAYRRGRSTSDHLLTIQELFYHYRFSKKGPRGGGWQATSLPGVFGPPKSF